MMRQDGLLGELRKVLLNRLMANSNIVRHPDRAGSEGRDRRERRTDNAALG